MVLYDQFAEPLADQPVRRLRPCRTDECVAVSTTSDATGSWNRYDFHLGSNFFDYPHLGVWPDGYYMSMNVFNTAGTAFLGPQPFVFDRAKMLAARPPRSSPASTAGQPSDPVPARRPRRLDAAARRRARDVRRLPGIGSLHRSTTSTWIWPRRPTRP